MPWSESQLRTIQQRLSERVGGRSHCAFCGQQPLTLVNGYARVEILPTVRRLPHGGAALPSLAFVCENCGYTHLFNVLKLGLEDLGPPSEPGA